VVAVVRGGSYAGGLARPDSDIDIGIYYREAPLATPVKGSSAMIAGQSVPSARPCASVATGFSSETAQNCPFMSGLPAAARLSFQVIGISVLSAPVVKIQGEADSTRGRACGLSNSPWRGMSEVPHSILGCLQSLPQRVLPRSHCCWLTGGVHAVLLLREATRFQSMEVGRGENL
jgi:Nucleotidyltransferase domain